MNRRVPKSNKRPSVIHVSSAHPCTDVRIHLREAASLAEAGYEVTLVGVQSGLPLPTSGVRVIQLPTRRRLRRMVWGSLQAIRVALRSRAKIVHLHDPELVWAIPLLRLMRRIVIFDAHEDLPTQTLNKTYLPAVVMPLAVWVSNIVVRLAGTSNLVIAATETIADRFPSDRVRVVRNYPRMRAADGGLPDIADRPLHVAYLGALSVERGAYVMIDALAEDEFPETWSLLLAGAISPSSLLDSLKERSGWRQVDYRGVVSPDKARDFLSECQVGLVTLQRTPAYLDSLPTKMFEYFAAGMPVIASDFPLWRGIIERYDCGLLVDETSPTALAAAINLYATDPELLRRHSENARAATAELNWESEEATLLTAYAALADRRGA